MSSKKKTTDDGTKQSIVVSRLPIEGSIIWQWVRCGKPNCKCANGEKHGPYPYRFWRDYSGRAHKEYIKARNLQAVEEALADHRRLHPPVSGLLKLANEAEKALRALEDVPVVSRIRRDDIERRLRSIVQDVNDSARNLVKE